MRTSLRLLAPVAAGGFLMFLTGIALGSTFTVSPLRLHLPPDGRAEVLRVQNRGTEAVLVQVEVVTWDQEAEPNTAVRTPEVIAVPPVVEIAPEAEQLIRLALRKPIDGQTERAYRLWVSEVPRGVADDNNSLFMAFRFSLPVFATPPGAIPDPVWTIHGTLDGAAELVLRNEGQAHLRVSKLELQEPGGAAPVLTIDQGATALPGKEHRWSLDRPAHALPHLLEVHAETPRGELVMPLTYVRD